MVSLVVTACGGGGEATTAPAATATSRPATTGPTTVGPTATRPATTAAPTAPPAATATAVAVPTGTFRFAFGNAPGYALLPRTNCCTNRYHLDPMYDPLIGMTDKGQLTDKSGFATSWTGSADLKTWTIKLRDTLVFHNGEKATAQDFKYTSDWHQSPLVDPARLGTYSSRNVDFVSVVDPSTVTVQFVAPNLFTLFDSYALSSGGGADGYLLSKTYSESKGAKFSDPKDLTAEKNPGFTISNLTRAPIGTGPYKYRSDIPNQEVVYEAVERPHWYFGVPRYRTAQFLLVPEDATRRALLQSGGTEAAEIPRFAVSDLRKANFDIVARTLERTAYFFVHEQYKPAYGSTKNPLSDVRVRRALSLAVDRQTLVDTFLLGQGIPTADDRLTPLDPAYKPRPVPKQDMAAAKKLLTEAGYPNGFEVRMWIWQLPGITVEGPQMAEAMAVWWEELGLKVPRTPFDVTATLTEMARGMDRPTVSGPWYASVTFKVAGLRPGTSYKQQPYAASHNTELEKAANEIFVAAKIEDYIKAAQKFSDIYYDEVATIPLFFGGINYALKKNMGGPTWNLGANALNNNLAGLLTKPDLVR